VIDHDGEDDPFEASYSDDRADASQDSLPQIELRIPGPWGSPGEFMDALEAHSKRFRVVDGALVDVKSEQTFSIGTSDPDDQIADIFAQCHRISPAEVDEIASHKVKVHVSGAGGSIPAARAMMRAGTALIRAGGYGVMVDNSGNTHTPRDWLALAGDKQPGGLYWAFVGAAGSSQAVWSCGMQCLGLRDAELRGVSDREYAGFLLHNFLGYTYQSGNIVLDGDELRDENGPSFRVKHLACTRCAPGTPFHNPYGVWLLVPLREIVVPPDDE
jgi:hypothetical protein